MSFHTVREHRVATFFLTSAAVGCWTFALTRLFSLMRITPGVVVAAVLGAIAWFMLIMYLGLED